MPIKSQAAASARKLRATFLRHGDYADALALFLNNDVTDKVFFTLEMKAVVGKVIYSDIRARLARLGFHDADTYIVLFQDESVALLSNIYDFDACVVRGKDRYFFQALVMGLSSRVGIYQVQECVSW